MKARYFVIVLLLNTVFGSLTYAAPKNSNRDDLLRFLRTYTIKNLPADFSNRPCALSLEDIPYNFGLSDYSDLSSATPSPNSNDQAAWQSATTDPRFHDENNYHYLVHAITDESSRIMQRLASLQMGHWINPQDIIDLLVHPERINEKPMISASFISQSKNGTFAPSGLILNAGVTNIIATSPGDMGSSHVVRPTMSVNEILQELKNLSIKFGIQSPANLINSTVHTYNEVIVSTARTGLPIKISGVFIKTNEGQDMVDGATAYRLQIVAEQLGVPLIRLEDRAFAAYEDHAFEILRSDWESEPSALAVNRDGIRHLLNLREDDFSKYMAFKYGKNVTTPERESTFYTILAKELQGNVELQQLFKTRGYYARLPRLAVSGH